MNYRSFSRNLLKFGRLRWIEVGLCVLAIATTVKTQAFAYTTIDAKTQAAMIAGEDNEIVTLFNQKRRKNLLR
ncbi:MAG: hypothetical protein SAL07_19580 [Oscillatoria sp. PMC 1051.18]|nr:hypothetical protein [Oscillatoria sp. PMC 1050.18]MEC5032106.1 hypothetical protein [Oscillatoria sp. PMC 1051.18]